jgi:hypothetical protein
MRFLGSLMGPLIKTAIRLLLQIFPITALPQFK